MATSIVMGVGMCALLKHWCSGVEKPINKYCNYANDRSFLNPYGIEGGSHFYTQNS